MGSNCYYLFAYIILVDTFFKYCYLELQMFLDEPMTNTPLLGSNKLRTAL